MIMDLTRRGPYPDSSWVPHGRLHLGLQPDQSRQLCSGARRVTNLSPLGIVSLEEGDVVLAIGIRQQIFGTNRARDCAKRVNVRLSQLQPNAHAQTRSPYDFLTPWRTMCKVGAIGMQPKGEPVVRVITGYR